MVWQGCGDDGERPKRTAELVEDRLEVQSRPRNLTVGASFEIQGRAVPPFDQPRPVHLFADPYPFSRLERTSTRPVESVGTTSDYFGFLVKPTANTRYQVRSGRFASPVVHVFAGPRASVYATPMGGTGVRFEFSAPVPRHLRVREQSMYFYISRKGERVFWKLGGAEALLRREGPVARATAEFSYAPPQGRDGYYACGRQGVAVGMGRPRPPALRHCGAPRIVVDDGVPVPAPSSAETGPTNGDITDHGTIYEVRTEPDGKVITWMVR